MAAGFLAAGTGYLVGLSLYRDINVPPAPKLIKEPQQQIQPEPDWCQEFFGPLAYWLCQE
jgi:hypothetical protein